MPISINPNMMREIIMDHYNNPINKRTPEDLENYKTIRMDSDSCIDDITIYLKIDNNVIKEACFDGVACTISTTSTDILCSLVENKTFEEAMYIIEQYKNMIYEKEFDEEILPCFLSNGRQYYFAIQTYRRLDVNEKFIFIFPNYHMCSQCCHSTHQLAQSLINASITLSIGMWINVLVRYAKIIKKSDKTAYV